MPYPLKRHDEKSYRPICRRSHALIKGVDDAAEFGNTTCRVGCLCVGADVDIVIIG